MSALEAGHYGNECNKGMHIRHIIVPPLDINDTFAVN
jgi:hypothetical protein